MADFLRSSSGRLVVFLPNREVDRTVDNEWDQDPIFSLIIEGGEKGLG